MSPGIFCVFKFLELILLGLMNDMVTLILIASMALWKISPHVINVSIIRILTARLVAVVCYYVSVHCAAGLSEQGVGGNRPPPIFWQKCNQNFFLQIVLDYILAP